VIVVEADDVDYAVAGGNVRAVAQRRGIAGFVIDGVIRDFAEVTKEAGETLDAWENAHRSRITKILDEKRFSG
jgi:regulator of RNase E activity RraA